MIEPSTPEVAERTRADDTAMLALVMYGAVFWGWIQLMDLINLAVGGLFFWGFLGIPIAWGLLILGLVQRQRWAWVGTLLLGALTMTGFFFIDAPVPATVMGVVLLYFLTEGSRLSAGKRHSE